MSAEARRDLILASSSPRRCELLARVGLRFAVVPSQVEEEQVEHLDESQVGLFAEKLARQKAENVAAGRPAGELVLGADTLVWLDGAVLSKPRDQAEAGEILGRLGGCEHRVYTGVVLVRSGQGVVASGHEMTRVRFRPLKQSEIRAYVASGEPMDKAGAYGAQGLGSLLIERIEGCYYNVVGLPLGRVHAMLREQGLDCLA